MASIRPELSEEGTNRHQVEMKMIDSLQDFLYEAEGMSFLIPCKSHIPLSNCSVLIEFDCL